VFRRLADVLFGHIPIKLPGWVLLLLAVIIAVPDLKSRYDFWLQVALSSGGWWATVATVLLWPYFSATLAIVGVLYLVMVSRPSSASSSTLWWISAALCFIAIVATVGYGATEIYIRTEIAKVLSGVPRTASPSAPNSGAQQWRRSPSLCWKPQSHARPTTNINIRIRKTKGSFTGSSNYLAYC
jgi:hypothetical protein